MLVFCSGTYLPMRSKLTKLAVAKIRLFDEQDTRLLINNKKVSFNLNDNELEKSA